MDRRKRGEMMDWNTGWKMHALKGHGYALSKFSYETFPFRLLLMPVFLFSNSQFVVVNRRSNVRGPK